MLICLAYMVFNATQCSQQYFGYIVAVRSIGEGNMSTRRKPQTCRKSLTNLSNNVVPSTHRRERGSNSQCKW